MIIDYGCKMKLFNNMKICDNVCKSLKGKKINKLIYISSDAVYSDTSLKITEKSKALPNSIHGMMHLMREISLQINFKKFSDDVQSILSAYDSYLRLD